MSEPTSAAAMPAALHQPHASTGVLALGTLGVVFGDIGTSPLYAMKESLVGPHPLPIDQPHVFGVLSLVFWTMMLIVTFKYVLLILRADNHGEGGSLALLALVADRVGQRKWTKGLVMLGIAATALFFGDAIITPAISVLSAVEGLSVVEPGITRLVLPLSIGIRLRLGGSGRMSCRNPAARIARSWSTIPRRSTPSATLSTLTSTAPPTDRSASSSSTPSPTTLPGRSA